mgnify:CR=1 FL=1
MNKNISILQTRITSLERAIYNYNYEKTVHDYKGPAFLQDFLIASSEYLVILKKRLENSLEREKDRQVLTSKGELKRKLVI